MAIVVATPALLLPDVGPDSTQVTLLVAMVAAILTFIEYNAEAPSIVEFRDAAPFNRLRFLSLFLTICVLTILMRGLSEPSLFAGAIASVGTIVGNAMDFPYSPVRLLIVMLPSETAPELVNLIRVAAGIAYLAALITLAAFIFLVRVLGWPSRKRVFNVWINLPLFDPTAGGDVLTRLNRDARINIALGCLLPFLIPALLKLSTHVIDPIALTNHQALIWTVAAWAFLPASVIMRGIAMHRIAEMIADQRRRAFTKDQDAEFQPA